MAKFYDAKDNADLARVEALLHKGGIEYHLTNPPTGSGTAKQIEVAEEDLPTAEDILQRTGKR